VDLYLIRRIEQSDVWRDEAAGFVVAAVTYTQARKIASEDAGDEGKAIWLDPRRTTAEKLAKDTRRASGVVLADRYEG
jgi:hypothetical protein